jgi:cytochrome P450 family 110
LLLLPFNGERMRAYGQLICDGTKQVINQQKIGEHFVARSFLQEISLQVILRAVFGMDEEENDEKISQFVELQTKFPVLLI